MNKRQMMRSERGQASVEFAIFALMMFLAMLLMVQLAVIAIQKWQFTHYTAYTARAWSTHTDWSPLQATGQVFARGVLRWDAFGGSFVLPISRGETSRNVKKGNGTDINASGLRFEGLGRWMQLYRPFVPLLGVLRFESFIPMTKEPTESPNNNRRDNDCTGTPCSGGNGQ